MTLGHNKLYLCYSKFRLGRLGKCRCSEKPSDTPKVPTMRTFLGTVKGICDIDTVVVPSVLVRATEPVSRISLPF